MPNHPVLTSDNSPLHMAAVPVGLGMGAVAITLCPGKRQAHSISGCWARDLDTDLDAIAQWGAAAVVSLMPMAELQRVAVGHMGEACEARGMDWFHLPIEDLQAPDAAFEVQWHYAGLRLRELLRAGRNVLVHCRGGLGRSGTVAARLLVELGWSTQAAMAQVRQVRPGAIETQVQEQHLQSLAENAAPALDAHWSRVYGCVLGGAVGDAFGYAVEFDRLSAIVAAHGPRGLQEPVLQHGQLVVSDDTQMTLFTLEALSEVLSQQCRAAKGAAAGATAKAQAHAWDAAFESACRQAYLRWGDTQGERTAHVQTEGGVPPMYLRPALRKRRAPGNTCLSAVAAGLGGRMDSPINDSKGCGAVMRTAPIGLLGGISSARAMHWGNVAGALSHGHIDGWLPAGLLAALVQRLMAGSTLNAAIARVLDEAAPLHTPRSKVLGLLRATLAKAQAPHQGQGASPIQAQARKPVAVAVAQAQAEGLPHMPAQAQAGQRGSTPLTADEVALLGEGWVGEEALALAVYAALTQADFKDAIRVATNHSGDSDSTASIAGQLCGARDGVLAVPHAWVRRLDVLDETLALLAKLVGLQAAGALGHVAMR